ncbi:DUF3551 domain-containing protein [Bradyrhizobium sp. CCGUVB1N3]|uniref:DUF3551 domain-containing protein n=1 Tax=Bradyrhizobium sp. CCGUVB1N3 TaxID=2949629 RepID=UPI0020B45C4F|nr:DUF3551 domain-containing protein [Bradyrhizobium sp. CCGUVB1N3]MCP3469845.1 DUF3551 domain-containing protein [Bradyrhizobium sp. CCGUVB1N3]
MRTTLAILALLAAATAARAGSALPASYDYPWCVFGEQLGWSGDCSYETRAQCLASASGRPTTYCDLNPRVLFRQQQTGQQPGVPQPRVYRRQ